MTTFFAPASMCACAFALECRSPCTREQRQRRSRPTEGPLRVLLRVDLQRLAVDRDGVRLVVSLLNGVQAFADLAAVAALSGIVLQKVIASMEGFVRSLIATTS